MEDGKTAFGSSGSGLDGRGIRCGRKRRGSRSGGMPASVPDADWLAHGSDYAGGRGMARPQCAGYAGAEPDRPYCRSATASTGKNASVQVIGYQWPLGLVVPCCAFDFKKKFEGHNGERTKSECRMVTCILLGSTTNTAVAGQGLGCQPLGEVSHLAEGPCRGQPAQAPLCG